MAVSIEARNESTRKGIHRRDVLERIAARVLEGEGVAGDVELSVLFCDDPFIADLNRRYRKKTGPTDVLSFAQEEDTAVGGARALGDIVISLETVERFACAARCACCSATVCSTCWEATMPMRPGRSACLNCRRATSASNPAPRGTPGNAVDEAGQAHNGGPKKRAGGRVRHVGGCRRRIAPK